MLKKVEAYFTHHAHAFFASLGRISRTPFTSSMTILVLAIAIGLPGSLYLMLKNAQQVTGNLESNHKISLFLKQSIDDSQARKMRQALAENKQIEDVSFISKRAALEEFKQHSGFGEAIESLQENPLPSVIQVTPAYTVVQNKQQIETLYRTLSEMPQVELAQIDMLWVERLQSIMALLKRAVILLGIVLGLAVLLITSNTIRLELQSRQQEVLLEKLMGATNAFIRRPFLYHGFWYGFLSGLMAWVLITVMGFVLKSPVQTLAQLYNSHLDVLFLNFTESVQLILIASILAVIGAWIMLLYQLQQLKPE